jgi:uncharacterized repeat protein (TIGR01451 family)
MPPADGQPLPPPTEIKPPVVTGKLELTVDGPKTGFVNEPTVYTIKLQNGTNVVATKAVIACDLPKGAEFVAASEPGKNVAGHVAWLLGDLQPGEVKSVQLTWKGKAAGEICLEPFALADPNLQANAKKCTTFQAAVGLGLLMEDTVDPVAVGDKTSYVIVVRNQGSLPATNIVIKGFVPKELKLTDADGPVKFAKAPGPDGSEQVLFEPVKSLPPQTDARYEVLVEALAPGDVRFKVELTADQLKKGGPVQETESTRIIADEADVEPPMLKGTVEPAVKE